MFRAVLFFHPVLNPYPRANAALLVLGAALYLVSLGG